MVIKKSPDYYVCSARGCDAEASGAIVWANPKIHFGRTKTWLCCPDHEEFLTNYLRSRNFPAEHITLTEFLAQGDG